MSEWKEYKLGDTLITANTGLDAIKRAPIVDRNTGIKCLRIQDISQNKSYTFWGNTEVTDNNYSKFRLIKNDIIVARTGATVGVNMYIKSDLKSVFNNGLIRLRAKNEFNSKRNTVTSVFTPGITYSTSDDRYKNARGYLEAVTGLDGKVSGIGFFPSANEFSIEFKLDDANATNPIDRTKVKESLIARLGTNDVTYNEKTDMFSVGKIGAQAAPTLDPYYNIEPLHRSILSILDGYSDQSGTTRTGIDFNIGQNKTVFHINKLSGNTPQSNKYILHAGGKAIKQTYGSALEAYSVATGLASNPDALGYMLNVK